MGKINQRQKALLHVTKAQLCLSDSAYRAMLKNIAGVESSTELTNEQFNRVMEHLRAALYKIPRRGEPPGKAQAAMASPSKKPMMLKIRAILLELNLPWSYADRIARRMFGIDRLIWCNPDQIHKVVAAFCYHQRRKREARNQKGSSVNRTNSQNASGKKER